MNTTRGLLIVLILAAFAAAAYFLPGAEWTTSFAERVRGTGGVGVAVFFGAYVVATVAFLPGSLLTLAAGFAYGTTVGTRDSFQIDYRDSAEVARAWQKQFDAGKVLDRAMQAFWSRGYEATSMQDLVTCTGINRASLYATYGDKHALFLASLRVFAETVHHKRLADLEAKYGPREATPPVASGVRPAAGAEERSSRLFPDEYGPGARGA